MRVTLAIYSLEAGGAQRVAIMLANALSGRGHQVTVVTFTDGTPPFKPLDSRVTHRELGGPAAGSNPLAKLSNNLRRALRLRSELRRTEPDCVVSFIDQLNVVTSVAALGLGCRVVVAERVDPAMAPISGAWKAVRNRAYWLADAIVMQTRGSVGSLPPGVRARAVVIPNPVQERPVAVPRSEAGGRRLIVAVGRLVPQKGFDLLIDSVARLQDVFGNWDVAILGEGPERSALEAQIARLGLAGRVTLQGLVPDVDSYLQRADLFVLPSRFEGFPNALCEAMSCGVASIAADCRSGPRDIIHDGVDGLLVPTDDVDALSAAMSRLMSDDAGRARLAAEARRLSTRYSLDAVVDAWEAVITPAPAGSPQARSPKVA